MKKIYLFVILIAATTILFTGCDKDKDETQSLVMIKRSTGVLYSVDRSTGAMTEKMTIMYNSNALTGLRGLVYDPETGKCFAGATNSGDGKFYSIDLSTGTATLLNDNSEEDWDAIADMVMAQDGNVLAIIWSNLEDGHAVATINKSTGAVGTHHLITESGSDIYSGGGICYGSNNSTILIGGEESEIYTSGLTGGNILSKITLVPTSSMTPDGELYVMDLEKDTDGTVFAIVYDDGDEDNVQYFVKVNTSTGGLTEIRELGSGGNTNFYHCMALIPESKLN
jgi:hypothetical protein